MKINIFQQRKKMIFSAFLRSSKMQDERIPLSARTLSCLRRSLMDGGDAADAVILLLLLRNFVIFNSISPPIFLFLRWYNQSWLRNQVDWNRFREMRGEERCLASLGSSWINCQPVVMATGCRLWLLFIFTIRAAVCCANHIGNAVIESFIVSESVIQIDFHQKKWLQ